MRNNSAFTLIELLVVIAIIALLLSVMLPALGKAKENFTPWATKFWTDDLAANHTESACFAFADGHAEKHKWDNKNTSKQFKAEDFDVIRYSENEDVAWAWDHFPLFKRN